MAYVYLIRHETEPMFKIGKSNDPFVRSLAFGEKLDLDNSLRLHLGKRYSDFEKGLHALFDSYRLPSISDRDGATEWFKIECWNRCLAFLEQNHDLIGTEPEPIPQPAPASPSDEERAERRLKNKESERLRIYKENLDSLNSWECFLHWLETQETSKERINEHGHLEIALLGILNEDARTFFSSGIGRSGLNAKDGNYYPCGILEYQYEMDGKFTLMLKQFDTLATGLLQSELDPDMRIRFLSMNDWIVERMCKIR